MLCLPHAGGINMANALDMAMAMAMAMVKIHHFKNWIMPIP